MNMHLMTVFLTYCGLNKIADILYTTFSDAFKGTIYHYGSGNSLALNSLFNQAYEVR